MGDTLKFQGRKIKVLNLGMKVEYVLYFKDEKKIIFKYILQKANCTSYKSWLLNLWIKFL